MRQASPLEAESDAGGLKDLGQHLVPNVPQAHLFRRACATNQCNATDGRTLEAMLTRLPLRATTSYRAHLREWILAALPPTSIAGAAQIVPRLPGSLFFPPSSHPRSPL